MPCTESSIRCQQLGGVCGNSSSRCPRTVFSCLKMQVWREQEEEDTCVAACSCLINAALGIALEPAFVGEEHPNKNCRVNI